MPPANHSCDKAIVGCVGAVTLEGVALMRRAMKAAISTYFSNTACRCSVTDSLCMPVSQCSCSSAGGGGAVRSSGSSSTGRRKG